MLHSSVAPYIPFLLALGLARYTPFAFVIAIVLLAVPPLRRHRALRWLGYLAASVVFVGGLSGIIAMLQFGGFFAVKAVSLAHRTQHFKSPQTFLGIHFPAGTTITLDDHDPHFIEAGTLPSPTLIYGLPVVGDFRMPAPKSGIDGQKQLSGTLAQPTLIAGIPCAAAAVNLADNFTGCLLAQPLDLHGFTLAQGTYVQTRRQTEPAFSPNQISLEQATLGRPTLLFDTLYPPGTILTPGIFTAQSLAHLPYQPAAPLLVCLPPAATVDFAGATLHGPLSIRFTTNAEVDGSCPYRSGNQKEPSPASAPGFGLAGSIHFVQGLYDFSANQWTSLYNTEVPDLADPGGHFSAPLQTSKPQPSKS